MGSFFLNIKRSLRHLKAAHVVALSTLIGLETLLVVGVVLFSPFFVAVAAVIIFAAIVVAMVHGQIVLAELAYNESTERWELRSILNNLTDAVIMYDQSFTVLMLNTAAEDLFKVTANDVVGQTIEPQSVHDEKFSLLAQVMYPSLAPRISQLSDPESWPQIVSVTLENPRMELTATLHRVFDANQVLVGFLKIIRDRTREVEILESKNEFIGTAAHQLRTPLSGVRWALESLSGADEKNLSSDLRHVVREALKLAERSLKITNDLLDAAKIEEGRFGYEFKEVNLVEIIRGVVEEAATLAREMNVSISFSPNEHAVAVYGDASRIAMVVTNLLDNAIKYNVRGGTIIIRTEQLPVESLVRVSIEDTGVGVPKEEIPKLFHKLHRGSNVLTIEPNGSGLGLYIAKNIVERHGGSVGTTSVLHRGSVFWFTLPTNQSKIPHQRSIAA